MIRTLLPRVAFLDRDGTINVKASEGEYVTDSNELILLPGAAAAVRRLNDASVKTVLVTNQRGIALGRMTEANLDAVHTHLRQLLREEAGADLDLILHCPHDLGQCTCRKPLPGMLEAADERIGPIDRASSVMIGDAQSDVDAGQAFGVSTLLLGEDPRDLWEAVDRFMSNRLERSA